MILEYVAALVWPVTLLLLAFWFWWLFGRNK